MGMVMLRHTFLALSDPIFEHGLKFTEFLGVRSEICLKTLTYVFWTHAVIF